MKRFKLVERGSSARKKLKQGMNTVYDTVKDTLGPAGRNVVIEEKAPKKPTITNDGISIAKRIVLKDEFEDLGGQILVNAALKTNDKVGDGTTTSMVLGMNIINEAFKEVGDQELDVSIKSNVMDIKRKIDENRIKVLEELDKMKKPVKNLEELTKVATAAVEDPEMGRVIAEMIDKIGVDGYITVESGFKDMVIPETIQGMKLPVSYLDSILATNDRKEAIREDVRILVTNRDIEKQKDLIPIMQKLLREGIQELVVFAPKFDKPVRPLIYFNVSSGKFYTLAVKSASLTDEQFEDLAIYTGAKFFDKREGEAGELGDKVSVKDLGKAQKIRVNEDDTVIIGGKGKASDVKAHIEKLKGNLEEEKTKPFQNKIKQRIASMSSGVGVIKVGAKTDVERNYIRLKVEDGVYATKAAVEDGVVPGGGLALKKVSEKLPKNILTEALKSPYNQIQENAGGKLKIGKDVLDPVKVVKTAFENACSMASVFITIESAVANECRDLEDNFQQAMERIVRK